MTVAGLEGEGGEGALWSCPRRGPWLGLLLVTLGLGGGACSYRFVTRPPLPEGVAWIEVKMFQNQSAEPALGSILASAFEAELGRQDRLRRSGVADPSQGAYLRGRVRADRTAPVAFPPALLGVGLYTEVVSVELRLQSSAGKELARASLAEDASFEAGAGPERTEANRRRALARLAARLAQRGWEALLEQAAKRRPAPPSSSVVEKACGESRPGAGRAGPSCASNPPTRAKVRP